MIIVFDEYEFIVNVIPYQLACPLFIPQNDLFSSALMLITATQRLRPRPRIEPDIFKFKYCVIEMFRLLQF